MKTWRNQPTNHLKMGNVLEWFENWREDTRPKFLNWVQKVGASQANWNHILRTKPENNNSYQSIKLFSVTDVTVFHFMPFRRNKKFFWIGAAHLHVVGQVEKGFVCQSLVKRDFFRIPTHLSKTKNQDKNTNNFANFFNFFQSFHLSLSANRHCFFFVFAWQGKKGRDVFRTFDEQVCFCGGWHLHLFWGLRVLQRTHVSHVIHLYECLSMLPVPQYKGEIWRDGIHLPQHACISRMHFKHYHSLDK